MHREHHGRAVGGVGDGDGSEAGDDGEDSEPGPLDRIVEEAIGGDLAMVVADFDALEFVLFCARQGSVAVEGKSLTLLTAPMAGFYSMAPGVPNPGRTQLRIAVVYGMNRWWRIS